MSSNARVLVVDDDNAILFLFQEFFRHRGDRCEIASNGNQALAILEEKDFDVLLTDMSMPNMDGLELIRRAKALHPYMVCVLMSGVGTRGDIITAMQIGVFDFLDKPFRDMSACSMVIDRAAERGRLLREYDALLESLKQQNAKLELSLNQLHDAYGRLRQQEEMLESDLVQAQRVQRRLLPQGFPRVAGFELFGYFAPCERLGGDFFGAIPLGEGRLAAYLVDVAGHGVSAAMITVILRELIHAQILLHLKNDVFLAPDRALAYLNQGLVDEAFDPPILVTMIYAVLDTRTGKVTCASAGHPPPILVSGPGEGRLLPVTGPVLGMDLPGSFQPAEISLDPGDFLLFYSDGVSEARDPSGREYSEQALAQIVSSKHGHSVFEIGGFLENAMNRFLGTQPPADDMTFLVAGRPVAAPAGPATVPLRDGEIVPNSVKVVLPSRIQRALPPMRGGVLGGWGDGECVIALSGVATWQQAPLFRAIVKKADEESAGVIHVDLADCQGVDSTITGQLFQLAPRVILHQPGKRPSAQLREMGVLSHFQVLGSPAPAIASEIVAGSPDASREACSDLILSAHEALMRVSDENKRRFSGIVQAMRSREEKKPS